MNAFMLAEVEAYEADRAEAYEAFLVAEYEDWDLDYCCAECDAPGWVADPILPAECPGDGCSSSLGPCHWACDPRWCLEAAYAAVEEANEDACTVHGWAAYAA